MKVLFLDVDGVLNSSDWFYKTKEARVAAAKLNRDDSEIQKMYDHKLTQLDHDAVALLNTIVEQTGCSIVLSSTWRKFMELHTFKKMMTEKGFKYSDVILDITQDFVCSGSRGWEIHDWLNYHPHVESFCILDDDCDMWHLLPWLVNTSGLTGLSSSDVDLAVKMLNNPKIELPEREWIDKYRYFDCADYGLFD